MIVADGYKSAPLGKVFNILIKVAGTTIGINILVVDTTSYEVVLEIRFLKKIKATIDLNAERMCIRYRGRRFKIPIDIKKGVHPSIIQEVEDEDEETFFVNWKNKDQELRIKKLHKDA